MSDQEKENQPPVRIEPWPAKGAVSDMHSRPFDAPMKSYGVLSSLSNTDRHADKPRNMADKSVGERETLGMLDMDQPYVPGQALAEIKAMFEDANKPEEKK
jgi:hypothetical protein